MHGIDVSEWNGNLDFQNAKHEGVDFVIVRAGWGEGHLDSCFYKNINKVLFSGLAAGVYYYSEALTPKMAREEAEWLGDLLRQCGLVPDKLRAGVWLDMEDDPWKIDGNLTEKEDISAVSGVFLDTLRIYGYEPGIYSNADWLKNKIDRKTLKGAPIWCAEWNKSCSVPDARLWQYTDHFFYKGSAVDASMTL